MKKTFSILFPHESIKYTSSVSPSSTFSAKWFSVPKATIWKILASNLQKIQLLCCVAGAWSDMFIACPIMNSWFSEDFLFVFGDTSCFFSTSLFPFTWQEFNYRSKENHLLFHFLACTHNLISQNLFVCYRRVFFLWILDWWYQLPYVGENSQCWNRSIIIENFSTDDKNDFLISRWWKYTGFLIMN